MRGRVIILLVLIAVAAAVAVAAVFLGGSTEDGEPAPTLSPEEAVAASQTAEAAGVQGTDGGDGDETPAPAIEMEFVVIALQDLPRGFRLTENFIARDELQPGDPDPPGAAVGLRLWPSENVPENSIDNVEELENMLVRSDIPRESPVLTTQVVLDTEFFEEGARIGSDAALVLPPGQVAVSIPMDRFGVGAVARGLQPGDEVDVILSFLFIDVDEIFQARQPNVASLITRDEEGQLVFSDGVEGRVEPSTLSTLGIIVGPSEVQRPRLVTQRTVTNALVIHVGFFPEDGRILGIRTPLAMPTATSEVVAGDDPPTPTPPQAPTATKEIANVVTVGVPPQEALVLVWALDAQIPMTFALRSAIAGQETPTTAVSLQYMLTNYAISEEDIPNLPFALEPPVRSLRTVELDIFSEFVVPAGVGGGQ